MTVAEPLPVPIPINPLIRLPTTSQPVSDRCPSFLITAANKSYKHQYSNIYFVRLRILRQVVETRAKKRWEYVEGHPVFVPRVLEVTKGRLCWIVGTIYMDMPLKPNVLEDIARDRSIPPPPPLEKFCSPHDTIMLEDESGRIHLVGERIKSATLVTGVILAALGVETPNGDFEVLDMCHAGMASHIEKQVTSKVEDDGMNIDGVSQTDEWIALISGLDIGSPSLADAQIQLLIEYLTGEAGGREDQALASQISRLIIAGNSLAPPTANTEGDKKARRYGHDPSGFSPHPIINLSAHLLDLARVMPVHLLPGATDPAGVILPQQPLPRAMFGAVSSFSSFKCETNPTYLTIASDLGKPRSGQAESSRKNVERTFLVNSGQPLNDMWKYIPEAATTRLSLAEWTLRWRHMAPTAPDTLWCHPYFAADPFIIQATPDVYVIGDQPKLQTKLIVKDDREGGKRMCRIVLVPKFAETGVLVLVNLRTLGVTSIRFDVKGMDGDEGTA